MIRISEGCHPVTTRCKICKYSTAVKSYLKNVMFTSRTVSIRSSSKKVTDFDSHASGMAVTWPYGFEIDFVRNPISESAA